MPLSGEHGMDPGEVMDELIGLTYSRSKRSSLPESFERGAKVSAMSRRVSGSSSAGCHARPPTFPSL